MKSLSEMKRRSVTEGRAGPYWICDACAKSKGWTAPDGGNTIIRGLCGHCDRKDETFLTPIRDFKKPLATESSSQ
jgi:hypothetical protein